MYNYIKMIVIELYTNIKKWNCMKTLYLKLHKTKKFKIRFE